MAETMNVRFDREGAVAILTLDRPDRLNAMADPMWDALYEHLGKIAADDDLRAVILTAAARTAPELVWPPDLPRSGDLGRAFASRLEAMAARVAAQSPPRLEAALGMATLACQST